jgi:hypothetical protein
MNTSQKGSAAVTTILVIVLLAALAFGVYLYMHHASTPVPSVSSTTTVTDTSVPPTSSAPATTTDTPALPPHATAPAVAKVYTDKAFGFTITYPKTQTTSVDKNGTVTFYTLGSGLPPVTAAKATNSADTSTGKWGKNVLSYSNSGWVTQMQNEQDGSLYTAATVPFAFTAAGLPIFNGGTHHGFGSFTYVVALSHTKFVIVTGPEGVTTPTGYDYTTDPTLLIAKATEVSN